MAKAKLQVVGDNNKRMKKLAGAKATGTFIVVEKLTEEECMDTTLIVPNGKSSANSNQAFVVDIGPALERDKWGINVGDRVLLQGSFVPVPVSSENGRELAIVSPHDVKAVLVEAGNVEIA